VIQDIMLVAVVVAVPTHQQEQVELAVVALAHLA
jgi:hypothetical protein